MEWFCCCRIGVLSVALNYPMSLFCLVFAFASLVSVNLALVAEAPVASLSRMASPVPPRTLVGLGDFIPGCRCCCSCGR